MNPTGSDTNKGISWDITGIREYFEAATLPDSIRLDEVTRIHNTKRFIETHLSTVEAQKENDTYLPYYLRLVRLRDIIKSESNIEKYQS